MLAAHLIDQGRARQVVIAGNPEDDDTRLLLGAVKALSARHHGAAGRRWRKSAVSRHPAALYREVGTKDGQAAASVCEGMACRLQTADPAELARMLGK